MRKKLAESEAKLAALAAENAGMNKFIKDNCFIYTSDDIEPLDGNDFKPETPATDAFLAEMRAQAHKEGAHFVANRMLAAWDAGFIDDTAKNAADIARMILTSTAFMAEAPEGDFDRSFADGVLEDIAAQLRKGVQS
ncbi:ead/Ea22-like family protein [Enterobacter hormaechei]|nr:ead/Ea22-like family protein [Enterobacter hormaechei]MBF1977743.1 ead/Ea22-like family protein [Enterobacter hormaechei]